MTLDPSRVLLVFTTFPDADTARELGTKLVEEQVAACVNLLAPALSVYRWNGGVETAAEVPAIVKTTAGRFPELRELLLRIHPYEVPELVAVPVEDGAAAYLSWVAESVCG
jgi:periplasmic divalent cation tolerance protein